MLIKIINALCLSAFILGCSTLPNSQQTTKFRTSNILQHTRWQLVEFKNLQISNELKNKLPSIEFTENKISGSDGCNKFIGSYSVKSNEIALFKTASTTFTCINVGPTLTEFRQYLKQIKYYEINASELILLTSKQTPLLKFKALK